MTTVRVREGAIDKALRSLKKSLDKEAVMKVLKTNRYHKKPSEKQREKAKMALKYRRQR